MAFKSYVELKASLLDWLIRPDLSALVGSFIDLFEGQANRALRTRWQETVMPAFVLTGGTITVPADHLGTRTMTLTTGQSLHFVTPQQFDDFPLAAGGLPRVYTLIGNQYIVGPAPTGASIARLVYWRRIPPLSTNSTNWLLANYPDTYLYGSLMHAAPYLNNDERLPTWIDMARRAMESVVADDIAAKYPGPLTIRNDVCPTDGGSMN